MFQWVWPVLLGWEAGMVGVELVMKPGEANVNSEDILINLAMVYMMQEPEEVGRGREGGAREGG